MACVKIEEKKLSQPIYQSVAYEDCTVKHILRLLKFDDIGS